MTRKSRSTITAKHTVRAYVKDQSDLKPHHLEAIDQLEKYLGRTALLADLNDHVLTGLFSMLGESRFKPVHRHRRQTQLLKIARDAAERGIIEWPSPNFESLVHWAPIPDDPGGVGIRRYFENVYVPDRNDLSKGTITQYRRSIAAYERFIGGGAKARICRVDRKTLQRFRDWWIASGVPPRQAANHAFNVAAVAKHANPERFIQVDETPPAYSESGRALQHVFEAMYLPARPQIQSERTEHLYRMTFGVFGRYLGHIATLDDLSDETVGAFMRHLKKSGRAATTVNGYRDKLRALWEWCARKKLVDTFPTIGDMPVPVKMPTAWTEEQLHSLFMACAEMPGEVAGIPAPDWWRAIHLISWDTGERTGALFQLRWDMLDLSTGKLVVPAECRKGGRKPMPYVLKMDDTIPLLRRIRPLTEELILPWEMHSGTFYNRYKKLLKLAGLPYVRWKSCLQKMRRSFASHLEAAGGNATVALAHTSRAMTERSYLDPVLLDTTPPNELLFSLKK